MAVIRSDRPLDWAQVAAIAAGEPLELSGEARARIAAARVLVEQIVERGIRAYGVNTGVGALCDVIVSPSEQRRSSISPTTRPWWGRAPTLRTVCAPRRGSSPAASRSSRRRKGR